MITVIVTGHGSLADGMLNASKLISGSHRRIYAVNFPAEESTDDLKAKLREAINAYDGEVLILADIAGGSPFNMSVLLKGELTDRCIEIVSGVNVPMLVSAVLEREGKSAAEVAESITETAQHSIHRFEYKKIPTPQDCGEGK
ncbi:MAG: PTS sugar transporter subunit IIA [Angelakisella sp.]